MTPEERDNEYTSVLRLQKVIWLVALLFDSVSDGPFSHSPNAQTCGYSTKLLLLAKIASLNEFSTQPRQILYQKKLNPLTHMVYYYQP